MYMERYYPSNVVEFKKPEEPLDVRLAEFSKKLDLFQMGGGAIYGVLFNPVVGGSIIGFSLITYFAAEDYQKRKEAKNFQKQVANRAKAQPQESLPLAA